MFEYALENKGLSIDRLRLLCEVARAGGIKAAIGNDPTKQSLASRQLKELTEYVGSALTHRSGRTIEMTSDGVEFAVLCNDFFAKLEAFLRKTRNQPSRFHLGVGDAIFQWQLLPKMKDFQKQFPNIQLIPFSYSTREIIEKVNNRTLDAGLVRKDTKLFQNLNTKVIGEFKYQLFIPRALLQYPCSYKSLPQIKDIPFCTITGEGKYAKATAKFLAAFGASSSLNCSSMTQMFAAVQSGQYAAILPMQAEASLLKNTTATFTLPELVHFTRKIALIYKPDLIISADKKDVVDFLSEHLS